VAKKPPAIYQPGELDRIRQKLGDLDRDEARRMASVLGGQVGVERTEKPISPRPASRRETVEVTVGGRPRSSSRTPHRRVEPPEESGRETAPIEKKPPIDPGDDPTTTAKASYRERVRMDRYAAQSEFEIKNASQLLYSMLSLFGDPPDLVNPAFTTRRLNEYYARLESLVTTTRNLLPRTNVQRAEKLRKESPFAYSVIDLIRQWNVERIASELARLQARPRDATVSDFTDILRAFYRPLYLLGRLEFERHIRDAYRSLYKVLLMENPVDAKEKHQGQVRTALVAYSTLTKNIRFLLYPLLLKFLSDRWFSYDDFFVARRRKIAAFLNVSEAERLVPPQEVPEEESAEDEDGSESDSADSAAELTEEVGEAESPEDEAKKEEAKAAAIAEKKRSEAAARALSRGLDSLEALFPEAGWQRLPEFPDLFPYFADVFEFKKGTEVIAPTDPMQQIVVLMHILEELFYGLRYVSFGTIAGPNGEAERVDDAMNRIISGWHFFIEAIIGKEYLPRLSDYCRVIDGSSETGNYTYSRRTLTEILWIKRLHFLPYLHFEYMMSSPPIRRPDDKPFYVEVRDLRRLLTGVAAGIETGMKLGGAARSAPCDGIDNPWEPYTFQIPNPLSIRLDALLGGKQSKRKTNAALVFFTLSVATVLDSLINDENSWAYGPAAGKLFRSVKGEGVKPLFGVDEKVDADAIFKRVLKEKAAAAAVAAAEKKDSTAPKSP
jgi:hypothetical protein